MPETPHEEPEPITDMLHTAKPRTIQDALQDVQALLGVAEGEGEGLDLSDPQRFNYVKSRDLAHEAAALLDEIEELSRQQAERGDDDPVIKANIELAQGSLDEILREQEENPPE